MIRFEWDPQKDAANQRKHGIAFNEAATVFFDPLTITIDDPRHSSSMEERLVTTGESARRRLVVVVHADRGDIIRIISARRATRREKRDYEEGQ